MRHLSSVFPSVGTVATQCHHHQRPHGNPPTPPTPRPTPWPSTAAGPLPGAPPGRCRRRRRRRRQATTLALAFLVKEVLGTHGRTASIAPQMLVTVNITHGSHCSSKHGRNEQADGGVSGPFAEGAGKFLRLARELLSANFNLEARSGEQACLDCTTYSSEDL